MKLYDFAPAPSPRRVRIFLAEKGLTIPTVQVDLRAGEQMRPEFAKINPWRTVPALELDDGTVISEASACCRYIEEIHPEPALLGRTPKEKAVIAMWDHHCEVEGFLAGAEALRNEVKGMSGRALPGPVGYEQIPALAERGRARVRHFLTELDERLAAVPYVAGEAFSIADITAFVVVEFAGWVKLAPAEEAVALRGWLDGMRARPSAKA